jgi:DNA helicase-2/ATP-dependent DNA helicase PcrA
MERATLAEMDDGLNPPQREAVNTLSGPLLVLAGAGTGKTRVVTFRIAKLIKTGIRPNRILAVTFTNKAAGEMQERAGALLGKAGLIKKPAGKKGSAEAALDKPEISTFHSLCVRVLRRHIQKLGYPQQFAIYDRGDQESTARSVLREIHVPNEVLKPGDLLSIIGNWKTKCIRPHQAENVAETDKEHLAAMAYRRYQAALKACGAVDFDDLLLCTEELFTGFKEVRELEAKRFDHVLVDEYQDTNGSQYRIIKALAEGHRNLCVVGDDDQSIYGWRGAEVTHILGFRRDWPEAKIVRLEDNYRSTAPILEISNRLIAYNKNRYDKVLRSSREGGEKPRILQFEDEEAEATNVVDEIDGLIKQGVPARNLAILFRTNEQPRAFEAELRRAKVPYTLIGGMSFYDRKEVRDVLSYLKVIANPKDEVSLLRIINTPARGLGRGAIEALVKRATTDGVPLWEILPQARSVPELSQPAIDGAMRLRDMIVACQKRLEKKEDSIVDIVRDLLVDVRYRDEINRNYKEPADQDARWNTVEELVNAIGIYEGRGSKAKTLGGFLDEVALNARDREEDKESQVERNAVVLMTMHSAKGLEFPHVYLVGMEEGLLPHRRSVAVEGAAIDEERRLCYVGLTRAQDRLTLTLALSRFKWGRKKPTIPSRFLFELNGKADNPQAKKALQAARKEFSPVDAKKGAAAKGPISKRGRS